MPFPTHVDATDNPTGNAHSHSSAMHLVRCPTPQEPLEDAPRTALAAEPSAGEQWDGFWSSDVYYVRCTTIAGGVEWFKVADDEPSTIGVEARVLALRPKTRSRSHVSVVVAQSPDGRRMLVGGSVRRSSR
jgi:hypothetical protein